MPPVYIVCFNFKSLWIGSVFLNLRHLTVDLHHILVENVSFKTKSKTIILFSWEGRYHATTSATWPNGGLFTWRVQFAASVKLENDDDHLEFCKNQLIQVKQKMFSIKTSLIGKLPFCPIHFGYVEKGWNHQVTASSPGQWPIGPND